MCHLSLGGGFKDFLFSALLGEIIQFDEHIFEMGWFNHQPVNIYIYYIYTLSLKRTTIKKSPDQCSKPWVVRLQNLTRLYPFDSLRVLIRSPFCHCSKVFFLFVHVCVGSMKMWLREVVSGKQCGPRKTIFWVVKRVREMGEFFQRAYFRETGQNISGLFKL